MQFHGSFVARFHDRGGERMKLCSAGKQLPQRSRIVFVVLRDHPGIGESRGLLKDGLVGLGQRVPFVQVDERENH